MKAQKNSAPTLRIHKGTGHARCRINGREYWLGRSGTPECEARYRALMVRWAQHRADTAAGADTPPPAPSGPTTFAAALAGYLTELKAGMTAVELRKNARWWLARSLAATLEQYAAVRIDDFGPKMLTRWVEGVASAPMPHKRGGVAVTRTTTQVRKLVAELLRLVEWCVAEELVTADKLVALRSVKRLPLKDARSPTVRKPVDDDAMRAAATHLPPVYRAIVTILRHSAARPGEILDLRPGDIDTTTFIHKGVWVLRPAEHKTQRYGRERIVALGPQCRAALGPWLAGVGQDDRVFSLDCLQRVTADGTIRLRARRPGLPITATDLRRAVRIACEAATVKKWTPYTLRHRALTEFRRVGGMDAAQVQGGHSNAATTERYAAANIDAAIEAARVCG